MKNRNVTLRLVTAALLVALMLMLGLTGLGLINVGVIYVTLLCVPVIIGTQLMGLKIGIVLAACFGAYSFYTAMKAPSALVAPLQAQSVPLVFVLCVVPRLLIPVVTHATFMLVNKRARRFAAAAPSAALGSLTNTVLYLGALLAFYGIIGLDSTELLAALGGIVLLGGIPEAIVAALIAAPVVHALDKAGCASRLAAK